MIEIKNISKKLGDTQVLQDLSLNIESGSILGLVGVNGAGKSTLLRCLSDVYKVDSGQILINSCDINDNIDIKKDILFLSDDSYCPLNFTLSDIKSFYKTFYEFDEEKFFHYLEYFKLPLNKNINNFSKGMKRQVFILMALSIEPKILILDESFDGLDPLIRLELKKVIREMIKDKKRTVIISSHNLKELEDICDTFAILDDKKIKSSGLLDEKKENIYKYQLVFKEEKNREDFLAFDIVKFEKNARVNNIIIRGDKEETLTKLYEKEPLLLDILPVNFEELFISELERGNLND